MLSSLISVMLTVQGAVSGGDAFIAGRDAALANRYNEALASYQTVIEEDGPLSPYAIVRVAGIRARQGELSDSIALLRDLLEKRPEGPWVLLAQERLGGYLSQAGAPEEAARMYGPVTEIRPLPWWMEPYAWNAAQNLLQCADLQAKGRAFFRDTALASGSSKVRKDAADLLVDSTDPADVLVAAWVYLRGGDFRKAAGLLARIAPDTLVDDAQQQRYQELATWLRIGTGEGEDGLKILDAFVADQGDSPLVKPTLLYTVRNLVDRGKMSDAQAVANRMAERFPGAEETGDAFWRLGQGYASKDDPQAAMDAYDRLAASCPTHYRANEGLFIAAMYYYQKMNQPGAARTRLAQVVERNPNGRYAAAAIYWLGYLDEAKGASDDATGHYRKALAHTMGDYYAHRALARLEALGATVDPVGGPIKADGASGFLWAFDAPGQQPDTATGSDALTASLDRIAFLGMAGCEEAEWEAMYLLNQPHTPEERRHIYRVLADSGLAHTAVVDARAHDPADQDGHDAFMLYLGYPKAYWPIVTQVSAETGVDPYLLLAVGLQESTFRASIRSWAGAQGVMQVMPPTAKWLAKVEPALDPAVADQLEVPAQSLRLGGYYLMRMIERSGGNLVYALASYNAGPGNVDKWRRRLGDVDLDYFVEAIPFAETRTYVKRVLGAYAAYRSLYGSEDAAQTMSIASP